MPLRRRASGGRPSDVVNTAVSGPARIEQGAHSWPVRAALTLSDAPDTAVKGTFHGVLDGLDRRRPVTLRMTGGDRYTVTVVRYFANSQAGAVASIRPDPPVLSRRQEAPGEASPG